MSNTVIEQNRGLVDMLERIFRVLLNRPSFKNNVQQILNNIDADAAPQLARTLLWEDMAFTFSVLGALPAIANVFIRLGNEIVKQVQEKISPEMISGFMESLARDVDVEAARELKQNFTEVWNTLEPVVTAAFAQGKEAAGGENEPLKEVAHGER
ncbi:MAG: hypothetical protein JW807_08610 [Spirochaetes bacterium]|nr:hypothetical protein [Spirochaetota bacterium]